MRTCKHLGFVCLFVLSAFFSSSFFCSNVDIVKLECFTQLHAGQLSFLIPIAKVREERCVVLVYFCF